MTNPAVCVFFGPDPYWWFMLILTFGFVWKSKARFDKYGPNELPKAKQNNVLKFLGYYWSPLAWAMEIAALISIALVDYVDFILIFTLLTINATIGFYEEYSSGAAVKALQNTLAPTCRCYRDGKLEKDFPAVELVPGDVIFLRLGDVVPADCYVCTDSEAKIDQAALTGESLPATKRLGDEAYSGSAVKQGEFRALVYGTGTNTFFGNAARLISEAGDRESHINVVLRAVAWFCITFILIGVILELVIQFGVRGKQCKGVRECQTINNTIVLIVGGIPIAMPTVLSVMQALGALELSKEGAIVVRLTAIEEIAGMEILCSDKTGTLTLNKLTVDKPLVYGDSTTEEDVMWTAAMAANKENTDAIDIAMLSALDEDNRERYNKLECLFYHPFDPVDKWTYAKMRLPDGRIVHAAKGAPQVILDRCNINGPMIRNKVERGINSLARRGYRSIGVATSDAHGRDWKMIGLIPLFDPPRHDTKDTIERTLELGVGVKMITGDQLAIAIETAQMLGMSGNIIPAAALKMSKKRLEKLYDRDRAGLVEWADGFAQVLPEDKFLIVESLQADHSVIVGMTGDGVNDAPALKKADIGIAVADATDAARGAADIVLTQPGLSVIVSAIYCSRTIFQRMKSYTTYSVCAALRVVLTFTLLTCIFDFYFPTIAVVFFAILNDGTMITLARDRTQPSERPEKWDLFSLFLVSIAIGVYLTLSTVLFYYLITHTQFWSHFGLPDISNSPSSIRGVIYLQVSLSGLAVVFSTRCHKWMWSHRPSWLLILAFVICQGIASVLGAYGLNNYASDPVSKGGIAFGGAGWGWVLATWIWCIIWFLLVDPIKRLFGLLAKIRIRRTKDYLWFPFTITVKTRQEDVVDIQRRSFEETRKSRESVSIDLSGGGLLNRSQILSPSPEPTALLETSTEQELSAIPGGEQQPIELPPRAHPSSSSTSSITDITPYSSENESDLREGTDEEIEEMEEEDETENEGSGSTGSSITSNTAD